MIRLGFLLFSSIIFYGCATYTEQTSEVRSMYASHNYKGSLTALEESVVKEKESNKLLYLLEKAMIYDRLGKAKKSRTLLLEASNLEEDLYTESISKKAVSFVYNDTVQDYSGEDYEKVAIHLMLMLSFLEEGNLKSALISARKINNKLNEINQKYSADSSNRYKEDAFSRYLSAVVYESNGEWDNAIIDYRKALKLYEKDYSLFYQGNVIPKIVAPLYCLTKKRRRKSLRKGLEKKWSKYLTKKERKCGLYHNRGALVVVSQAGQLSPKIAKDFTFPVDNRIIRFSFPYIPRTSYSWMGRTGINIKDKFFKAENFEDLQAIAHYTLEDKRGRMILKSGARLLAKLAVTDKVEKEFGPLAGLLTSILGAATETADTRSWTLLPQAFYVTRMNLKPGSYNIQPYIRGRSSLIEKVKIKKNKITIAVIK